MEVGGPLPNHGVAERSRSLRDVLLIAGWVFSYAALIRVFRILKRVQSPGRPRHSG